MPTYTFQNKETGEQETLIMSMAEREEYLSSHPEVEQLIVSAPVQIDSFRVSGIVKPSQNHKDRMREIQKAHPLGKVDVPG